MNKDTHYFMRLAYIREEQGSQCGNWDEQVTMGKVSTWTSINHCYESFTVTPRECKKEGWMEGKERMYTSTLLIPATVLMFA